MNVLDRIDRVIDRAAALPDQVLHRILLCDADYHELAKMLGQLADLERATDGLLYRKVPIEVGAPNATTSRAILHPKGKAA